MTPKDICVPPYIARDLKEAGFPQDTLLCWSRSSGEEYTLTLSSTDDAGQKIAAPTAEELMEQLLPIESEANSPLSVAPPKKITFERYRAQSKNFWRCAYGESTSDIDAPLVFLLAHYWVQMNKEDRPWRELTKPLSPEQKSKAYAELLKAVGESGGIEIMEKEEQENNDQT